jgi:hypothetical protein
MSLDPVSWGQIAKLWLVVKPVRRIKAWRKRRKMASWLEEHGQPMDEIAEDFNSPTDEVVMGDAWKGAAKSKLVWLGIAQVLYGLFELWVNGTLTVESAGPIISGGITVWLRAITTQSLADKA